MMLMRVIITIIIIIIIIAIDLMSESIELQNPLSVIHTQQVMTEGFVFSSGNPQAFLLQLSSLPPGFAASRS